MKRISPSLPGDWAPESADEGNNNLSSSLLDFRTSSRNASANGVEIVIPILHSSRGSDEVENRAHRAENEEHDPVNMEHAQREQADRSYRRPLPQPRTFEGIGDRSIRKFFTVYERYASSMWGQVKNDWVAGLEVNLAGWALVLYRGLVDQGKTYEKIKADLISAFPGLQDPFRTRNLIKLLNMKKEQNEPLPVFYQRIDQIIAETYPDLTDHSHDIQVRDTFLMKLDSAIALRIANYCNARGDFEPARVREAATVITNPDLPNSGRHTDTEDVFLINNTSSQNNNTGQVKHAPAPNSNSNLRCYICAGPWHPVSACQLYPMVFSCPICRSEPHAVTECPQYNEWIQFRKNVGENNGLQGGNRWQTSGNTVPTSQTIQDNRQGYSRNTRPFEPSRFPPVGRRTNSGTRYSRDRSFDRGYDGSYNHAYNRDHSYDRDRSSDRGRGEDRNRAYNYNRGDDRNRAYNYNRGEDRNRAYNYNRGEDRNRAYNYNYSQGEDRNRAYNYGSGEDRNRGYNYNQENRPWDARNQGYTNEYTNRPQNQRNLNNGRPSEN